jgi:Zn-finger protein
MSGDDYTPRPEPAFRPAGPGHTVSMRCGKCNSPMRNYGRRLISYRGAKVWACQSCQKQKEPA